MGIYEFIGEEVGNFEFLLGSFYFLRSKRQGHVLKKRRAGVGQGAQETAAVSCSSCSRLMFFKLWAPALCLPG